MNVGNIISGSQLLQKAEHTQYPTTTARERSVETQASSKAIEKVYETATEQTENKEALKKEEVKEIVSSLNEFLEPTRTSLKFEFHEKLEEYYVTIIDSKTDEVIKEIPPKKLLDAYASMAELMGFIVDEKA